MKKSLPIFSLVLLVSALHAQAIADFQKEQGTDRPKPHRVITNSDLKKFRSHGNMTSNSISQRETDPEYESTANQEKNEKWRARVVDAEQKIERLKLQIDNYNKEITNLRNGILIVLPGRCTGVPWGYTHHPYYGYYNYGYSTIIAQLNELESKKQQAEIDLKTALEDRAQIEAEARKAGILPGVLRGQKF